MSGILFSMLVLFPFLENCLMKTVICVCVLYISGRDICRHFCQLWENLSVFILNTLSSVQRAQVLLSFRGSRARPMCITELTKISYNFFPSVRKGREKARKEKSVTDTPPYFEQNTQTYPMSVRGEPAATRFIVYISPSPLLDLES